MKRTPLKRKTPMRRVSVKHRKWDAWRRECRQAVVVRSNGMCEYLGCVERGSDWHHACGRGNKGIHEPDASSPELTVFLCKLHHGKAHADPGVRDAIRWAAAFRLAKKLGADPPVEYPIPLRWIVEMLDSVPHS